MPKSDPAVAAIAKPVTARPDVIGGRRDRIGIASFHVRRMNSPTASIAMPGKQFDVFVDQEGEYAHRCFRRRGGSRKAGRSLGTQR
jgi:hypothetical protein